MGMPLPLTGDIMTVPVSIPPVPGVSALAGSFGGACGSGAATFFFATAFFFAVLVAGFSCF